jgi:hypothetical protein
MIDLGSLTITVWKLALKYLIRMWKLLLQELSVQRSIRHEFFSMLILLDWLKAINRVFDNAQKSENREKRNVQSLSGVWVGGGRAACWFLQG